MNLSQSPAPCQPTVSSHRSNLNTNSEISSSYQPSGRTGKTRAGSSPNPISAAGRKNLTPVSDLGARKAETSRGPKSWTLPWTVGKVQELLASKSSDGIDDSTSRVTVDTLDKLKELRKLMAKHNLDYYIIPRDDAHQSEQIAMCDKRLEYISGFSGPARQAVVSMTSAYLIVDSQHHLEVVNQPLDFNWELIAIDTPVNWVEWLVDRVMNSNIGIDARMISIEMAMPLILKLKSRRCKLVYPPSNLVDIIWTDQPPKSKAPIFVEPMKFAGKNALAKLNVLRDWLRAQPAAAKSYSQSPPVLEHTPVTTIITSLTCIAYLLNLRGSDIPPTLFRSYLFVGQEHALLFIDTAKVNQEVGDYLKELSINIREYRDFWGFLRQKEWGNGKIFIAPQTSYAISLMLTKERYTLTTFINQMELIKNENELEGIRDTNGPPHRLQDGHHGEPTIGVRHSRTGTLSGDNGSNILDLTGKIFKGEHPSANGGFADVWKCIWRDGLEERKVAVKVLRQTSDPYTEDKIRRRMRRELGVWQRLRHENVLQLFGTADDFGPLTAMVCPWLEQGDVTKLIERSGDIMTVSELWRIILDVAAGLSYLHSCSVVHGDLTGMNILITDEGKACLCDFGLSTVLAEIQGNSYFTSSIGGSIRWAAPELFRLQEDHAPQVTVSTQTDMYSFGSIVLQILSGRIPYHYIARDSEVLLMLTGGFKPRRPARSMTEAQWQFIQQCWDDVPAKRPNIKEATDSVKTLYSLCSSD